jgi:hypothetical protein
MKIINFSIIFLLFLFSCSKENLDVNQNLVDNNNHLGFCNDSICVTPTEDKVFIANGVRWLWGGNNEDWHFNINDFDLDPQRLKSGLGREFFKALIEPEYTSIQNSPSQIKGTDEFIIIYADEGVKAYSLDLLVQHEVINDVIDGQPIMVGYCVIADFAAVYSRIYCGETFTFALSGYTYSEPEVWYGRNGFVLWDRDTESLWWPLIGEAVSGDMIGVRFNTDLSFDWDRVDWDYIKNSYPDAKILTYGQDMETPLRWDQIDVDELDCN